MRNILLARVLILTACVSVGQAAGNQEVHQDPVEKKAPIGVGDCPGGIGANPGDHPRVSFRAKNGNTLIICGSSAESEFDLYFVDSSGVPGIPLATYGAEQNVKVSQQGDSLILEERTYHNKGWIPVFRVEVACGGNRCVVGREKCVLKKSKSTGDLMEIQSYQKGRNEGRFPDEVVINHAADLALSGNKKAQDIFLKGESTLKLDGAVGEIFSATKNLILKLKRMKCL